MLPAISREAFNNIIAEKFSPVQTLKERSEALHFYLKQWNCVAFALFYALKSTVVNKERLKSIRTFFNNIASELESEELELEEIGFDQIVMAANIHRSNRKATGNQDYSKGTTDLHNAILSEFGAVIYEVDSIREQQVLKHGVL